MAMNKSYKHTDVSVTSASAAATTVPYIKKSASLSKWDLLLLAGIAKNTAGSAIANGAVAVWLTASAAGSITDADYITFTDATGRYGVTITPASKFTIRFYS